MSVPVTSRLEQPVVNALDAAVAAGLAPTRAAAVAQAVTEWIERHGDAAITESYRRAYAQHGAKRGALLDAMLQVSVESWRASGKV